MACHCRCRKRNWCSWCGIWKKLSSDCLNGRLHAILEWYLASRHSIVKFFKQALCSWTKQALFSLRSHFLCRSLTTVLMGLASFASPEGVVWVLWLALLFEWTTSSIWGWWFLDMVCYIKWSLLGTWYCFCPWFCLDDSILLPCNLVQIST